MWPNPRFSEEILNGKLHFLCIGKCVEISVSESPLTTSLFIFSNLLNSISLLPATWYLASMKKDYRKNTPWKFTLLLALREMCPNTEFFLVRIFPHSDWSRRDTEYLSIFSPSAGKYGPEKAPHLDTFHTVWSITRWYASVTTTLITEIICMLAQIIVLYLTKPSTSKPSFRIPYHSVK